MGGIENFMADLMHQQVINGHKISAIVHHPERESSFSTEYLNDSTVYRIPCLGQLAYAPISPSFGYYLNNIIKQEQPDVLHIHMPNLSAFWCLFLPIARKTPWVIHWHADVLGAVPDLKIKLLYPFYQLFEKALLKKAKTIIATSSVYFASSIPLQNFKNKVEVIPLGLKRDIGLTPKLQKNQQSDRLNPTILDGLKPDLHLLMVGRLTYYKGHVLIIAAIAKLKLQGVNLSLSIVGGGELSAEISEQIKLLGLSRHVQLLGKLSNEDLAKKLSATDLLCLPSIERTEAFGVVLLEAMRSAKPCLVTDVLGSGMSWVVQHNKTGFVVKHNDVDSLVDKLKYISVNLELLKTYGQNGQERFEKYFSIKAVSHKISKLYENMHQ